MGDSIIKTSDLVSTVKEYGQNSVALTDHGTISGWFDFNLDCLANNIKPIFGCEFYCSEKMGDKPKDRQHLIILAKNNEGKKLIQKLNHFSNKNYYYRPILSYDYLFENKTDDIIITSACSLGVLGTYILNKSHEYALKRAAEFQESFKHYYLELQFHDPEIYPDQIKVNDGVLEIAEKLNLPLMVSTDAHIMTQEDGKLRTMRQSIAWRKRDNYETNLIERPTLKTNAIGNDDLVLEFADETDFDLTIVKKAIKNTNKIADLCNAEWDKYKIHLPDFNYYDELEQMLKPKVQLTLGDF